MPAEAADLARRTGQGGDRMIELVRIIALGAFALCIAAPLARAQDFPTRPVTIVVGYTPGATSDLVARTIGERLNAGWGQTVIVDNRSGVSGNIAAGYVARAPGDGYTLMIVADVIAYAKANPGKLNYGSSGTGSPHHLAGELLRQKTGIDIVHVPYRGGGATINDLLGGHIKVAFLSLSSAVPHLNSGKIRIVAVVEKGRYAAMPDIPTIGETVPGFEMSSWVGFFAPAGTPAPLLARLNDAMVKVLTTNAVKEKLATLGLAVAASTPG